MDLNSKTGTGNIPPSMDMCELAPKFHSHRLGSASNSGLIHSYSLVLFTLSFSTKMLLVNSASILMLKLMAIHFSFGMSGNCQSGNYALIF